MDVITFPVNLLTTSGLSILLHGVISLPDVTSYDKRHFIRVYTVCKDKIDLQRRKYNILDIISCGPSMHAIGHSDSIVCSFMENSVGLKRVYTIRIMQ